MSPVSKKTKHHDTTQSTRFELHSATPAVEAEIGTNIAALHERLEQNFGPQMRAVPSDQERENTEAAIAQGSTVAAKSRFWNRLIKSLVGLALLLLAGWMPMQRLFQVSSVEAVVNARLVTLRAPIEGTVHLASGFGDPGFFVSRDVLLLEISNPRADQGRLIDIRRDLERAREERDVIAAKFDFAGKVRQSLLRQVADFRVARTRELDARESEMISLVESFRLQLEEAAAKHERNTRMFEKGYLPVAEHDRTARNVLAAREALGQASARRDAVAVELEAMRQGRFVGDGYNDQPRSMQRLDEIEQQAAALGAELNARDNRIASLERDLALEENAFALASTATVTAPIEGRVWETLTANGEQVVRGQELVRMLDCTTALVTATVSETVYNTISVGAPARFRFRNGGKEYPGTVVQLSGLAAAPANLAILPSALGREAYRATVAVQGIGAGEGCLVGRTGRVVFE